MRRRNKNLPYPGNYYAEEDPAKRLEILQREKDYDPYGDFRLKLFEKRYKREKNGSYSDLFARAWVMMHMSADAGFGFFTKKRKLKEWEGYAKDFALIVFPLADSMERSILHEEYKAFFNVYFDTCMVDQNYSTGAFGVNRLSDEAIYAKIGMELHLCTADFPGELNLADDFKKLNLAAMEAYQAYV